MRFTLYFCPNYRLMKIYSYILLIMCLLIGTAGFAQVDKEDKEEKKARVKDKVDYNVFRRQMLSLKEYLDERKKIPSIQKETKMHVKVVAYVDSTDGGDDSKTLTGFIRQDVGDNSTNVYEVTYDRALKKITLVKPTGEANEIEKQEKAAPKKEPVKTVVKKKSKPKSDEDDDDDADDEKPAKGSHKDKDDE